MVAKPRPSELPLAAELGVDPFDLVGDLIDGQFRVIEVAGEGDLSIVYRGQHEGVDAPVAIKCLNLPATLDATLAQPIVESFREGVRQNYRLARGNLHIAQSLACGTTIAPRTGAVVPYMVREWLEGRSLAADFEARRRERMPPRSLAEVMSLFASAAEALAYAHSQGLVHHWINPSNLFVTSTPRGSVLKVLDFGAAPMLDDDRITAVGEDDLAGGASPRLRLLVPSYAAPEQLDHVFGEPGLSTDVYAFALVLCEALSGRPVTPKTAVASEVIKTFRPGDHARPHVLGVPLPSGVEAVLARALAISPEARHADMHAFWEDLKTAVARSVLRPVGVASAPSVPPPRAPAGMPPLPASPPPLPVVRPHASAPAEVERPPLAHSGEKPSLPHSARTSTTAETAPAVIHPSQPRVPVPPLPVTGASRASVSASDRTPQSSFEVASVDAIPMERTTVRSRWAVLVAAASLGLGVLLATLATPSAKPRAPSQRRVAAHVTKAAESNVSARAVPPTKPSASRPMPFDRAAARRALDEVAVDLPSCTTHGSPRGPGSVRVIFAPSTGKVLRIAIGPPYARTSTGRCIVERFTHAQVDPFRGWPAALNYVFRSIRY